ncbi:MAG: V4R domain-containing protein [Thermoproteota archaeon]
MKGSTEVPKKLGEGGTLDLSRFTLDPNGRIFFTSLTLVNKPGALASTLSLLAKHEINIIGILSESISKKEVVEISMFIETPSPANASELESKLRDEMSREKIEVVKELRVFEHLKGFDADVYHFPLTVGPIRAVVFPLPVLVAMVKTLRTTLNPTAVQTILWYMGREIGSSMKTGHERAFAVKDAHSISALLRVHLALLGWGLMEVIELDEEKRSATIRLFDNWECIIFKGSNEPQSHFIRGVLAGFFSSLFKVEVEAKETKCIAKGDSYCEFEIKEKKKTS